MKFRPMSREEADKKRFSVLEPGRYNARIVHAEETTSKAGNDMFVVELEVFGPDGPVIVKDYLLPTPKMIWKLLHLAEALGIEAKYQAGEMRPADVVERSCCVDTVLEKPKPDSKYQRPQVRIDDYMKQEFAPDGSPRASGGAARNDDDIPF